MNKLQYAIAEGFVIIYSWYDQSDKMFKGRIIASEMAEASMVLVDNQWVFSIMGTKYTMDDNFFMDYGILSNDRVEANALAERAARHSRCP